MKKILTLLAATAALAAQATDYTHPMVVTMQGNTVGATTATISLTGGEGKYDIKLLNFVFGAGDESLPIGTVEASGLDGMDVDGTVMISASTTANIVNGDLEGVNMWMGPIMFPQIPVNVQSQSTATNMEAMITLTIAGMGDITVYFGEETTKALTEQSKTYELNEPLAVNMQGAVLPQGNADLVYTQRADYSADFKLKNFIFAYPDGTTLAFGNVEVNDLAPAIDPQTMSVRHTCSTTAQITAGDAPGVNMWMGPMMFPTLPVDIDIALCQTGIEGTVTMTVPLVGALTVYIGYATVAEAGVASVSAGEAQVEAVYDVTGAKVSHMVPGHIYIQKCTDGSCRKVVF